ncbi:universal stress protein [Marinobacter xiaoshiensis]|uniref:Universal stress protein n=1 Tax=Marinobacter xiaoshiensis TaxID=3073652 RepID=A0ABU2HDN5_9GAMM|nr:universal stress protein [Marinobacter sp. F60267]MDS1309149.1 universal stress protein [Marinobacter sp. F60267]
MNMPKINRVLYTTALGPHSRHVYRHALKLAYRNEAELIMLHVIRPVGSMGEALIKEYLPADLVEEVHDEGVRRVMAKMEKRLQEIMSDELKDMGKYTNVVVRPMVVTGRYDQAILDTATAEGADVIVMGTENRAGMQSSKTQRVIRRSTIPVYVVPTGKQYPQ